MSEGAESTGGPGLLTRLLVADSFGLFVAPLRATDIEPVNVVEMVDSLNSAGRTLPRFQSADLEAVDVAGDGDQLTPVHPVVLRQQGPVVAAWEDGRGRYVRLNADHLAVIDLARYQMSVEYLEDLVADSDWPSDESSVRVAVAQLAEAGLIKLERSSIADRSEDTGSAELIDVAEGPCAVADQSQLDHNAAEADSPAEADSGVPSVAAIDLGVPAEAVDEVERAEPVEHTEPVEHAEPVVEPAGEGLAHHEPRILEDLPQGFEAARVVAYRATVRTRRSLHKTWVRTGRGLAQMLLHRFGVESDDWDNPVSDLEAEDQSLDGAAVAEEQCSDDTISSFETSDEVDVAPNAIEPEPLDEAEAPQPEDGELSNPPESGDEPAEDEEPQGEHEPTEAEEVAPHRIDFRTPVFGVYFSPEHNASLGLGLIMAYARVVDRGSLNTRFDLRKPRIDAEPMLEELERTGRQAIVLFSNYLWSIDHNLEVSRRVKELNPNSITVHGGPHSPKYEGDAERFFADNPHVDVLARGEGELTVAEMLDKLGPEPRADQLGDYLAEVAGITFRAGTPKSYTLVRTPDRKRATDLNDFPSPYLTGEFDDIDPARWRSATIETNRGCPYGCTFCDWGSVTNSRIRQFDHDRVFAELEWLAARGISEVFLADANFGLFAHDVEVTRHIADLKRRYGAPSQFICSFAKNTVKNTAQIVRILVEAGICAEGSVALQTTDEVTLANVERHNIKVEKYDQLAAEFKRHRLPIVTDLLMGLPGATVESFKNDLQRCLDQEVTPRMMETVLLPNSPMNAPAYKERFQIETDENNVLVSSSSYSREDFEEMRRLRLLFRAFEHYGLLRHLFRWLQMTHSLRALDLIHEIDRTIEAEPENYPLLTWVGRYFDLITAPPGGWPPFYDEVVELLSSRYGIERDPAMETVLAVQLFLMPSHGRSFPDRISLNHDYVAWYHATSIDADPDAPVLPLIEMPPGELIVDDPAGICDVRLLRNGYSIRRGEACDNPFWVLNDWELASELARPMATAVPLLSGS